MEEKKTEVFGSSAEEALRWKKLSEASVKKDHWVDLRAGTYLLPNGRELTPYYTYHSRSFTVICARDPEKGYILVKQFRPGISAVTTEFPAGAIEPGEEPLTAAKRELLEETGCVSDRWTFLGKIAPNATIADNYAWCYAADDCRCISGQHLDATECVNIARIPEKEFDRMIKDGGIAQDVHVALYYMNLERIRREETEHP